MTINIPAKTPGDYLSVTVLNYDEFNPDMVDITLYQAKYQNGLIWNAPIAFDIETSRIDDKHGRFTFMYVWQCYFADMVIIGRTWAQWRNFLTTIYNITKPSKTRPTVIYVHNLAYEFAFMKSQVPIRDSFARISNHPMNAICDEPLEGIIFRCSYVLTNSSLAAVAKDTVDCPIYKQPDYDYSMVRTPSTPLTETELQYCVGDVVILNYLIQEKMKDYPLIKNIPLTATGCVRKAAYHDFGRSYKWQQNFLRDRLNSEAYSIYRAAFAGGDTHLAPEYRNETLVVRSYDLTSSYPSRWVNDFPASPAIVVKDPTVDIVNRLKTLDKLYIADMVICNVRLKSLYSFDCIAASHCIAKSKCKCENGRVVSAEIIRLCKTCIDWDIIAANYDFDILKVERLLYHTKKAPLSKPFRDFVWKYYRNKTSLKGVEGKEREYMVHGKVPLNSIYGMTVTDICQSPLSYDPATLDWDEEATTLDDILLKYYGSRQSFMSYQVGIWVTAYSRQDLHRGLAVCGKDAVYWDTDSIKYVGDHKADFDRLNDDKMRRLQQFVDDGNATIDDVAPMTVKGERKWIGLWDAEHHGEQFLFRCWGSKKYVCQYPDGTEEMTVAGLNKHTALQWLNENAIGLFEELGLPTDADDDGNSTVSKIPPGASGRTCSEISNEPRTVVINGETITERSYMNIYDVPYTFGDTDEHILYTAWMKKQISEVKKYAFLV